MSKIIKLLKWAFALVVGILGIIFLGRKPGDLHKEELKALKKKEDSLKKDIATQQKTVEELESKYEEWLAKWQK